MSSYQISSTHTLSWRHWAILGLISLGAIGCFIGIRIHTVDNHHDILQSIKELRREEGAILSEMLRIHSGLASSYDTLKRVQSERNAESHRLRTLLHANSSLETNTLMHIFRAYEGQRLIDSEDLNSFEITTSIIRSSLGDLPMVATSAISERKISQEKEAIDALLQEVLIYIIKPDPRSATTLAKNANETENHFMQPIGKSAHLFFAHIHKILDGEAVIQQALKRFSDEKAGELIEQLGFEYYNSYKTVIAWHNQYQLGLYFLFVTLICYVAFVVKKLRATYLLLRGMNVHLNDALLHAENASKAKGVFLANMSHEIRTPLNGISGALHILARGNLSAHQKEFLEVAKRSCEGLSLIINDVLDFSKIEAGKMELCEEFFDIRRMVEQTIQIQMTKADEKGIVLASVINSDVPEIINADAGRLGQILLNLVGNAVKFTSVGSVIVEVHCLESTDRTCKLRFEVHDTGIGIPEEKKTSLFDPFIQADISTTKRYGGTGLGLSICKELVSLMSGVIGIDSEPDRGSVFWFEITVERQNEDRETNRYFRIEPNNVRILFCGDPDEYHQVFERQFSSWGFQSEHIENVEIISEALDSAAEQHRPYTVLLITSEKILFPGDTHQKKSILEGLAAIPIAILVKTDEECRLVAALHLKKIQQIVRPLQQSNLFDCLISLIASTRTEYTPPPPRLLETSEAPLRDTFSFARILLAEDNDINQIIAREFFKDHGITPLIVNNGRQAFEAAQKQHFDLIFLDCHMPEMDGFEAASSIRRDEKEREAVAVPIIALTADVTAQAQERCKAVGMDSYLSKPLDPGRLEEVLKKFLKIAPGESGVKLLPVDPSGELSVAEARPPIDMAGLNARFCDNQDLVRMVLIEFEKQLRDASALILETLNSCNAEELFRQSHALKGAASAAGAGAIREVSLRLEECATNKNIEGARLLFGSLEESIRACQVFLLER